MKSRPYQEQALKEIREHYAAGRKRVLLHLATGGGKTHVFSKILAGVFNKGKYAIMVVRGKELVNQASERLTREGIPHGCLQAKHWNNRPDARIQVCSVDTLYRRKLAPKADLVVIDEAHLTGGSSYEWLLEHYKDTFLLPVTATPYASGGLRHVADHVVAPIGIAELIAQGYLVAPRYFAPVIPDLSYVKVESTGEYNNEQAHEVMSSITGSVVENYRKHCEGHPSICFAVNVAHSLEIMRSLNEAGIRAEHIEANTPDEERRKALGRLASGETKVISNVGILCTGVDMPYVRNIIMVRPTQSYNLFIQQAGRGTRPFEGKTHFKIIDHAGNIIRHGLITADLPAVLDASPKKVGTAPVKQCPQCYAVVSISAEKCECGYKFDMKKDGPKLLDGELEELDQNDPLVKARLKLAQLKKIRKQKGYKRGWLFFKLKDEFGEDIADQLVPQRQVPDWVV